MYHYYIYLRSKKKLIDKPAIECIFKCAHSVSDLWTDIIFTIILYLQGLQGDVNNSLWIFSALFCIVPYIVQCILSVWFIQKWQKRIELQNNRISTLSNLNYPARYEWHLIVITMIFGFFATIALTKSKLCYLFTFHSQLSISQYKQIRWYRFVVVVIMENIPQLIIQCLYIFNSNLTNENTNAIVYLSMLFSVLSILLAFFTHISYLLSSQRNQNNKCNYILEILFEQQRTFEFFSNFVVNITIKHDRLSLVHAFSNSTMEGVMKEFLNDRQKKSNKTEKKQINDCQFIIETEFVESSKFNKGVICVQLNITVLSNKQDFNNNVIQSISDCGAKRNNENSLAMKKLILGALRLTKAEPITLSILPIMQIDDNTNTKAQSAYLGKVTNLR